MKRIHFRRRSRHSARQTARSLLRELPNLFKLVFRLLRDPAVARFDKLLFGAVAVYMITPVDLIPDIFGVIGWVDDFYLLGLALGRIMSSAGPDRLLAAWDGNPKTLGYLVEGVEELGGMLPRGVRRALRGLSGNPEPLAGRRRPRRIRLDPEDRIHVEE